MTDKPPSDRLGELNLHKERVHQTRAEMEELAETLDDAISENEALTESTKNRLAVLANTLENTAEDVTVSPDARRERTEVLDQIRRADAHQ